MSEYKINWKEVRKEFDGSDRLFNACKRQYLGYLKGSIDDPKCESDVIEWMDSICSGKVNNPNSVFYIYG